MKIKVSKFIEDLTEDNFKSTNLDISKDDLLQSDLWSINKASEQIKKDLANNELSQVIIHVVDSEFDIDFCIETGIINLPFQDSKKVSNFFDEESEVETKLYLSTYCDYLNASKFHIDLISDDDFNNENIKSTIQIMQSNYETSLKNYKEKVVKEI
ncbi:hypothetical protein [Lactobacillus terrae]|uniref:hypothetical protein n=1 Tax=Lactobacillus terrae TaxID=2269374 RepID=UPI000C1B6512|nr:hypothetical protein [Lactobacillus terrae]